MNHLDKKIIAFTCLASIIVFINGCASYAKWANLPDSSPLHGTTFGLGKSTEPLVPARTAHRTSPKPDNDDVSLYPAHWGNPPFIQSRDLRQLPGGYGRGSGTLARWIQRNLDKDAGKAVAVRRHEPGHYELSDGRIVEQIAVPVEANWRRLNKGMGQLQVMELLGLPDKTREITNDTLWSYVGPRTGMPGHESGSLFFDKEGRLQGWLTPKW